MLLNLIQIFILHYSIYIYFYIIYFFFQFQRKIFADLALFSSFSGIFYPNPLFSFTLSRIDDLLPKFELLPKFIPPSLSIISSIDEDM